MLKKLIHSKSIYKNQNKRYNIHIYTLRFKFSTLGINFKLGKYGGKDIFLYKIMS